MQFAVRDVKLIRMGECPPLVSKRSGLMRTSIQKPAQIFARPPLVQGRTLGCSGLLTIDHIHVRRIVHAGDMSGIRRYGN